MPRTITADEAASRLENAGLQMSDRYAKGVEGAGSAWHSAASKAGKNYEEGVSKALAQNRWQKGIADAGATSYDEGVRNKGIMNWPTGMQAAGSKYLRKIQRYTSLWSASLPTPKGARGSAANLKRMQENVERFLKAAGR